METEIKERRHRLAEAFQGNPQLCRDIEKEFAYLAVQAMYELRGKTCEKRDWLAGFSSGLDHAADLVRKMELWKESQ